MKENFGQKRFQKTLLEEQNLQLLFRAQKAVLEAIGAIASRADSVFGPHYATLMPLLAQAPIKVVPSVVPPVVSPVVSPVVAESFAVVSLPQAARKNKEQMASPNDNFFMMFPG
mgnify:CR=1 FL=1